MKKLSNELDPGFRRDDTTPKSILSIQSHVAYGCVGNKAAVYPLQSMGFDVWPVNTVQFSNHTGYGKWKGEVFSGEHIRSVVQGIEDLGVADKCKAVLSGYMGSSSICREISEIARRFKARNAEVLYLCDPVIGNDRCYVKPEVLEFFKTDLRADIITPNQFEAETLSDIKINSVQDLKSVASYFHNLGIRIVIITGVKLQNELSVFMSDSRKHYMIKIKEYNFATPITGTGDLFSALFLGSYLATNNAVDSLKRSIFFMHEAVKNTYNANSNELMVTSVRYHIVPKTLPEATEI